MVFQLQGTTLTTQVKIWLANSHHMRILHVFKPVVNLVNEDGEVISLVIPVFGRGPFSIMLNQAIDLTGVVRDMSVVTFRDNHIYVGELEIDLSSTDVWQAKPNWDKIAQHSAKQLLHEKIMGILETSAPPDSVAQVILKPQEVPNDRFLNKAQAGIETLLVGLDENDESQIIAGSQQLAGLGIGLTPAGDDFLIGVMHSLWLTQPPKTAKKLCDLISTASMPRTNTISRAWLQVSAIGEVGEVWHNLLDAYTQNNWEMVEAAIRSILPTGHTSGADALAGFASQLN